MKIFIPYTFTDLNTYIDAERTNRYKAAKIKKDETAIVMWFLKNKKYKRIDEVVHITFVWHIKNYKKDPDNVSFSKKFILDGFVSADILKNDGFKQISGFRDMFALNKECQGVEVILEPITTKTGG